ncbi:hypothetical protein SNE40_019745 [Patella caerulea]|uniref:UDP-D-xylose:beta-D-glucoside alpha-1,3-D-xylosyltransferase n=1 Tax=Patella caerulea TaxID=87958 RepID=A0AAN8J7S8_PATCE
MKLRMIFKFGVTVIVVVAVIIYFLIETKNESRKTHNNINLDKLAKDEYRGDVGNNKPHAVVQNDHVVQNLNNKHAETVDKTSEIHSKNENNNDNDANYINPKEKAVNDNNKQKGSNYKAEKTNEFRIKPVFSSTDQMKVGSIHLSVVACGDRFEETVIVLKSAVLLTSSHLQFHIFCEKDIQFKFKDQLEFWPEKYRSKIDYCIYDITFPPGENREEWKTLFKPCASQRMFIPDLLTEVDSLLYVDTDVLFLSPIEEIYSFFSKFNATQLAALAPEHEDRATGWYNRFARHPYYGLLGVNSGVMLMNLTRIRQSNWLHDLIEYYKQYKLQITWGDQDLINIYFHYHPQELFIYPCEWNYRPDHCMYMSVCKGIDEHGVYLLHGSRRVMHNEKQPAFKAVYKAFLDHKFSSTIEYGLLIHLKRLLKDTMATNCGKLAPIFTKQLEKYCENVERKLNN